MKLVCALFVLVLTACGGAPATPATSATSQRSPAAADRDMSISIDASTSGASLQINVVGRGLRYRAGEAFEESEQWTVRVSSRGVPLRKVLNGPARIEREPTGAASGNLWNVTVAFTVAFAVPDGASSVDVEVQEPGGGVAKRRLPLAGS